VPAIRILSVGQCSYDDGNIRRSLALPLEAEVVAVDTHDQARKTLLGSRFDLILVNRVGDSDGAIGLDLVRDLKQEPAHAAIPTMLVSNFADAQSQAIALGAAPGFGKTDLGTNKAIDAIRQALAGPTA
jgi:CheY-like chemotaxis protein